MQSPCLGCISCLVLSAGLRLLLGLIVSVAFALGGDRGGVSSLVVDQPTNAGCGSVRSGQVRTGQDRRSDQRDLGQDAGCGSVRSGQVRTGQDRRSGQRDLGQGRQGEFKLGQVRSS